MDEVGKGNFDVYIDYESKDEIGILSRHFNGMVSRSAADQEGLPGGTA